MSNVFFVIIMMLIHPVVEAQTVIYEKLPDKKVEWSGDIRLRGNQWKESIDETRNYSQLRVRLGLKGEVSDSIKALVRLATATSAISTNQTLGDSKSPGMARRSFGLDLAYADWKFTGEDHLWLGRTANPFWSPGKVQTIYDGDLAFEGIALKLESQWSDSSAFANLGAFIVAENYTKPKDSVDVGLVALEFGYKLKLFDATMTTHLGTHHFLNIQNSLIGSIESGAEIDSYSSPFERYRGNSVYAPDPIAPLDKRYFMKNKYTMANVGTEIKKSWSGGIESTLFAEYVRNYAVGDLTQAYEAGISGKWGDTSLTVAHLVKDVDSVVAAFTDSDTNGGGTDNVGFKYQVNYALNKNSNLTLSHFRAKRGAHSVARDFIWTQADVSVSF